SGLFRSNQNIREPQHGSKIVLFSTLNPPFLFLARGELAFLPPVDDLVEICSAHYKSPAFSYGNLSFPINSLIFPFSITTNSVTSSGKSFKLDGTYSSISLSYLANHLSTSSSHDEFLNTK